MHAYDAVLESFIGCSFVAEDYQTTMLDLSEFSLLMELIQLSAVELMSLISLIYRSVFLIILMSYLKITEIDNGN